MSNLQCTVCTIAILNIKYKMIAFSHKLLEQVKVVAAEVDFHKHELFDVRTGCSYASGMKVFIPHTWDW